MNALKFHKRAIAFLLIFLISFQNCFTNVVYANNITEGTKLNIATPNNATKNDDIDEDDVTDDEIFDDDEELIYDIATPSNAIKEGFQDIDFSIKWNDSEFVNGTEFNLIESNKDGENKVKMTVNYTFTSTEHPAYEAGDFCIKVSGIGSVNREDIIEANVGADKNSSSHKTRDWSYEWDRESDIYTFTNNKDIAENSAFAGNFELVWSIDARESIHGYDSYINAEFSIPSEDIFIEAEELTFTNETVKDEFSVEVAKGAIYDTKTLNEAINANEGDYNFIRCNLGISRESHSRGLIKGIKEIYFFDPDTNHVGNDAIVLDSQRKKLNPDKDGKYEIILDYTKIDATEYKKLEDQYVYVAYPKSGYTIDKNIDTSLEMYGRYYEESYEDAEYELLASNKITIYPSKDFNFVYVSEGKYWFNIESQYDYKNIHYEGRDTNGSKMTGGTYETFYITGGLGDISNYKDAKYKLEVVDDFLYVQKNDGDYRELKDHEYSFKTVEVPDIKYFVDLDDNKPSDEYVVKVYGVKNKDKENLEKLWNKHPDTLLGTVVIDNRSHVINLGDDILAISICIEGVTKSIKMFEFPVQVYIKLDDTSKLEYKNQDNLSSGQLVNIAYDREYKYSIDSKEYAWVNPNLSEDNYVDDTNLGLADNDKSNYGYYLIRDRADIKFYEGGKSNYNATTKFENIKVSEEGLRATYNMGAYFSFKDEDYPDKFSLYTIFPEDLELDGYEITEDIWNIMKLSGFGLTEEELMKSCKPEVQLNYNGSGRTYIALHFNFEGKNVRQLDEINAAINVKCSEDKNLYVNNCLMIDKKISDYTYGKKVDDGSWGDDTNLFKDIDRDGIIEELLANNQATYKTPNEAGNSQLSISKFSKTIYSNGWVQDTSIANYGGDYQYRLSIKNGNGVSKNIVITDIIENAGGEWKGTLDRVEVQGNLSHKIYYSTSSNPSDGDWSETKSSVVNAIKVDFGDSELGANKELNVILHMKAPSDTSLKNKIARNKYNAKFDTKIGNTTQSYNLDSNIASVKLYPLLKKVVVTKLDKDTQEALSGAEFKLYAEDGRLVGTAISNGAGYAIFDSIEAEDGIKYKLVETKAPVGYELATEKDIVMNGDHFKITVEDTKKKGVIKVVKVNNLSKDIPVSDAVYTLYDKDGIELESVITDNEGVAEFVNISWGEYTVKETQAPKGYQLNDKIYDVSVNKNTVASSIIINTTDIQDSVHIKITKYASNIDGEHTDEVLKGVKFELLRGTEHIGFYETDENGEINIENIPYGDYILREYSQLEGYIKNSDNIDIVLSPDNLEYVGEVYNMREPGRLIINKTDSLGNQVSGIEFTLYKDEEQTEIHSKGVTNDIGLLEFKDLDWGDYWIKETSTPEYYKPIEELIPITITSTSRDVRIDCVNETVKGSVILTKVNKEKTEKLKGAKYTLYLNDNTPVGTYETNENGEIEIKDLEWGSYYFKEIEAPQGYVISNETIRFSINSSNAGIVQKLTAVDDNISKYIKITKTIRGDEINWDNGSPQFIFKIESDDGRTYYKLMTFTEDYVKDNIGTDGSVSQSVVYGDLKFGIYTVTEEDTSRYELENINPILNCVKNGDNAIIDLIKDEDKYGEVEFVNKRYERHYFSDTQSVTNIVKEKAKPTAIKVEYDEDEVKAQGEIDKSKLIVTVIYDDGSVRELGDDEYQLRDDNFPNVNGDYDIVVEYTDGDTNISGNDTVTLFGAVRQIISMKGIFKGEQPVSIGTRLQESDFEVIAYYNITENDEPMERVLDLSEYIISPRIVDGTKSKFDVIIELNTEVLEDKNNGYPVSTKVEISVSSQDPLLENGIKFNKHITSDITRVVFTDTLAPEDVKVIDVSDLQNHSVVAWSKDNVLYISSQRTGWKVIANSDSSYMFSNTSITSVDSSNLDTSTVTDMSFMFNGCAELADLNVSSWKTENVTNMSSIFNGCEKLLSIGIDNWNTSNVTNISSMFNGCVNITSLNVSNWDTSKVTDMSSMFKGCNSIQDISNDPKYSMNTSNVVNMSEMFSGCTSLIRVNTDGWITSKVTNMSGMFSGCANLTAINTSNWDTGSVTDMSYMFNKCGKLTGVDTKWDTSKVTNMSFMFSECQLLESIDTSEWDTENVTNMACMFYMCVAIKEINTVKWKTGNVTDMHQMFNLCKSIKEIKVNNWDTSNVINMRSMFTDCNELAILDVSNWKTDNVTDMYQMFCACSGLSTLIVTGWNTSNVINMDQMFMYDWNLTVDCTDWNVDNVVSHLDFNGNSTNGFSTLVKPPIWK